MNNTLFFKSFVFRIHSFRTPRHTDNSKGIDVHFIARMRSGRGEIYEKGKRVLTLEAGDVFYLPEGFCYNSYWMPDEKTHTVEWESYGFKYFPDGSGYKYAPTKLYPSGETLEILDRLAESMEVDSLSVGRLYSFLGSVSNDFKPMNINDGDDLLLKAREYISEHSELRVPSLARYCGMSESGLYAFFKAKAGMTPIEMKNQMQAERAVNLLLTTDLSVEEISCRLGYRSIAHFRRIVRANTGKTPTEIRKNQAEHRIPSR